MSAGTLAGLDEVADRIAGYATVAGAEGPLVTGLADAVRAADAGVVGVDLVRRYPPEALLPGSARRPGRLLGILESLRDVLIFVPLALTWYRFSQALSAYPADSKLSLLDFWRLGGHGVEPLATSAVSIAGLVALVIVLTLFLHTARGGQERAIAHLDADRARLGTELATASLLLSQQVQAGPAVTWESVREVAGQLARTAGTVGTLVTDLGAELRAALEASDARLAQAMGEWSEAAAGLAALGPRITAPEAVLAELTRLQESVIECDKQLRDNLDRLVAQLERASQVAVAEDESRRLIAERLVQANERLGVSLPHLGRWAGVLEETLTRLRTLDGHRIGAPNPVPAADVGEARW